MALWRSEDKTARREQWAVVVNVANIDMYSIDAKELSSDET